MATSRRRMPRSHSIAAQGSAGDIPLFRASQREGQDKLLCYCNSLPSGTSHSPTRLFCRPGLWLGCSFPWCRWDFFCVFFVMPRASVSPGKRIFWAFCGVFFPIHTLLRYSRIRCWDMLAGPQPFCTLRPSREVSESVRCWLGGSQGGFAVDCSELGSLRGALLLREQEGVSVELRCGCDGE